jgi:adenylosuccinate lyase
MDRLLTPADYIGRAAEQTEEFISGLIDPILDANRDALPKEAELKV